MSSLILSAPGKSFLAGEYLAVQGGPSLLFSSGPRFELWAQKGDGKLEGIHPESPAGRLIQDHSFFKTWDLKFCDPHQGRGGWGASTAQFLTAFVLNEWRESCELETLKSLSLSRLLETYWKYAWTGEGQRPSGADLVSQYKGSLSLFERRTGLVNVFGWSFSDIDFALIPTNKKLPTHEHLKTLHDFDGSGIESAMALVRESFQTQDSATFVEGIQANASALESLGFVASHTQELLKDLRSSPGVLAAKGCGAMGADVMFVVFEKGQKDFANAVTSKDLSHGLEIQVKDLI